jgi:hypothetical protein
MGRTRTIIGLSAVFVVAFAGTAFANHVYNDVPTSSVFHDEIAEIGGQGCADGFPGGLFKPADAVKRQQMARFLSRCGGRVAVDDDTASVSPGVSGTEYLVTDADFAAHADGYVVVTATGNASTGNEGLCPCQVEWRILDSLLGFGSTVTGQLAGTATEVGTVYEPMSVTQVFPIDQGDEATFSLMAKWVDADTTSMNFSGVITVEFFPFSGEPVT